MTLDTLKIMAIVSEISRTDVFTLANEHLEAIQVFTQEVVRTRPTENEYAVNAEVFVSKAYRTYLDASNAVVANVRKANLDAILDMELMRKYVDDFVHDANIAILTLVLAIDNVESISFGETSDYDSAHGIRERLIVEIGVAIDEINRAIDKLRVYCG